MADFNNLAGVVIYPAIGIARVGNSPDQYFIGPEIPGVVPDDPDDYRDAQGRIKRQAQRFRLYGVDADGQVIGEITADDAEITWTVEVANTKASWFDFDQALDIPASMGEVPGTEPVLQARRNPGVGGSDRAKLEIKPGPRSIDGRNTNAEGQDRSLAFDTGTFWGQQVYLGELRTDDAGRLLFLGGRGESSSYDDTPPTTFANNATWHDDISDGPVDAVVRIGGRAFQAEGAWVITAPPDYAPGIHDVTNGYDLIYQVAVQIDPSLKPARPSFGRDIYPLLASFNETQWVNAGFARDFGWGGPLDFTDPEMMRRLNDPSDASRALRRSIFGRFRDAGYPYMQANAWPAFYGDGASMDSDSQDPRVWYAVTELQYAWLRQWAEGDFAPDWPAPPKAWDEMTPAEQAAGMTKAALESTLGGAFRPGEEFSWPMRVRLLYDKPFRIKRRTGEEPAWGDYLYTQKAMAPDGPLNGSKAGDLSRWMAVPWQTDASMCLSAYNYYYGEYLPTFWPARMPNDILTHDSYDVILDDTRTMQEREAAFGFEHRKKWLRGITFVEQGDAPVLNVSAPYPPTVFIDAWWQVGIMLKKPGPKDTDVFPSEMWVETGRSFEPPPHMLPTTNSYWG